MLPMRTAPSHARAVWALMLALVLAVRLVTPAGFMPAVDHGRLTIVDCPGSDPAPMAPMTGMGHDKSKGDQTCPFATATGAGTVGDQPLLLVPERFAAVPHAHDVDIHFSLPRGQHDRPPAIGPPIPA